MIELPQRLPTLLATRIRTIIVDDEPAARRGIRMLLSRDPAMEVVGEASGGADALQLIGREKPELVFLDIQIPDHDGFEVLARLGDSVAPVIVFVTAHDEHALRAFEVSAVDYLLKPFDDSRFHAALARAKEAVRRRRAEPIATRLNHLLDYLQSTRPAPAPERILVKSAGEIFFLKPDEIDWIEAEGDYMKLHVAGKVHLMRETMARLEARLDPARFARIHRSTIVNLDRVRKMSPSFGGEYAVFLQDGTKLKLSRGYHERLATLLKG